MLVSNPRSDQVLFPGERILLVGRPGDLDAAERWLGSASRDPLGSEGDFDELRFASARVGDESLALGRTLNEIEAGARHGVQVVGVERAGLRILNPGVDFKLAKGDQLPLLATRASAQAFSRWLAQGSTPKR